MARVFTPQDAAALLAATVREATGQELTLQSINTSNWVSIGEQLLTTGKENVLNALSTVIFRELIAVRPYSGRFISFRSKSNSLFQQRLRKISFYAKDPKNAGNFNTQLSNGLNFAAGFTNGQNLDANGVPQSSKSMWEQDPPIPAEMFYGGSSVWEDSYQIFDHQLDVAFRSPEDLANFANGYITEKMNDIESQKEGFARINLVNYIAGVIDQTSVMPGSAKNMVTEYNNYFGTSKTASDLLTTDLTSFLEFFVATVKTDIRKLENRSALYHDARKQTINGIDYSILRHTPRDRQRMIMLADFWTKAEAMVKPAIFNPEYLDIGKQMEVVDFWQNEANPSEIDVTPAIFDQVNKVQVAGNQVQQSYIL
ncbi:MAG: hypothetical protein J6U97_02785, partial [Bacteroidaceae bacterium]|nr:hypothetical protein [Bacteroidaceae bacterium]